mgnify:CR=1 FL=1
MTNTITDKKQRTANIGFVKWRVQCLFENLVLNSNLVHLMKFSAKNPPLHKAARRCTEIPSGFPYNEQGFAPARSPSGLRTTWILHKAKPCAKPYSLVASFRERDRIQTLIK